jgi:lysozyme family protein
MTAANFPVSLAFVWAPGYDNPADGYHVTPGDSGGGTKGGVIEATWAKAYDAHLVTGTLRSATNAQLSTVLRTFFWGSACDSLPSGLDFALFNGRMMSAGYPRIFQAALGFMGDDDVDGNIGDGTCAAAAHAHAPTLIRSLSGAHYAYLTRLMAWREFGDGWTKRIKGALELALQIQPIVP